MAGAGAERYEVLTLASTVAAAFSFSKSGLCCRPFLLSDRCCFCLGERTRRLISLAERFDQILVLFWCHEIKVGISWRA